MNHSSKLHNNYKVLFIIGSGRSGSTVIASILGKDKLIANAGEIYNFKWFFDSAHKFKRMCSCKELLNECDYWKSVREKLKSIIGNDLPDLKNKNKSEFSKNNLGIFSAISEVSGKEVIIDSSKRIYRLSLLNQCSDIEVVILHLIRDVRAYAHSSRVTEISKGATNFVYYKKVFRWTLKNIYIYLTNFFRKNYICMRYEDFIQEPNQEISRICEKLDLRTVNIEDLDNGSMQQSHQFSGNSGVFDQGAIVLRQDIRYLTQVNTLEWWVATIIALPAIVLFKYPMQRRSLKK